MKIIRTIAQITSTIKPTKMTTNMKNNYCIMNKFINKHTKINQIIRISHKITDYRTISISKFMTHTISRNKKNHPINLMIMVKTWEMPKNNKIVFSNILIHQSNFIKKLNHMSRHNQDIWTVSKWQKQANQLSRVKVAKNNNIEI